MGRELPISYGGMMNLRIFVYLFFVFVLAGCGQAPFEQRYVAVCDEGDRPSHAAVTNMDGDAAQEIVVACNNESGDGAVRAYLSAPDGSLEEIAYQTFPERVLAIAPLPVNGSTSDLLVALGGSHERQIMHLEREADGFAEPAVAHQTRFEVGRMVLSDVNDDGLPDVVMPELDAWVLNEGTAESPDFTRRQSLVRGVDYQRVYGDVVDLDADGREDGSYQVKADSSVRLYSAQGQQDIELGKAIDQVGAALGGGDFNDDGRTDLVFSAKGMPDEKVVMLAMSGDEGEWTVSEPVPELLDPAAVLARDFDGDGHLDLLAAPKAQGGENDYSLTYLPGRGGADFGKPVSLSVEGFPYRMIGVSSANGAADVLFLDENGRLGLLSVKQ